MPLVELGTSLCSEARETIDLGCVKRSSKTDGGRPSYDEKTNDVNDYLHVSVIAKHTK